jgi:hypothetical protein
VKAFRHPQQTTCGETVGVHVAMWVGVLCFCSVKKYCEFAFTRQPKEESLREPRRGPLKQMAASFVIRFVYTVSLSQGGLKISTNSFPAVGNLFTLNATVTDQSHGLDTAGRKTPR